MLKNLTISSCALLFICIFVYPVAEEMPAIRYVRQVVYVISQAYTVSVSLNWQRG